MTTLSNKLFVASLAFSMDDQELLALFSTVGQVQSAKIARDPTGRSRGFGFVEMVSEADAQTAIKQLNNSNQAGRTISVSISQPKPRTGGGTGGFNNNRNGAAKGGRW